MYIDITKNIRIQASQTYQVFITSEPIINESKQGADLLVENLIPISAKPLQKLASKPKLRGRLRKKLQMKNGAEYNGFREALDTDKVLRTDLDRTLGKNPLVERLIKPV